MNPKTYFKRKLAQTVTVRRMLKVSATASIVVVAATTYLHLTVVPTWVEAAQDLIHSNDVTAVNIPRTVLNTNETPEDTLEIYFAEFYGENEEEFEARRKDAAMEKAVEKLESDLETVKEGIRERSFFQ